MKGFSKMSLFIVAGLLMMTLAFVSKDAPSPVVTEKMKTELGIPKEAKNVVLNQKSFSGVESKFAIPLGAKKCFGSRQQALFWMATYPIPVYAENVQVWETSWEYPEGFDNYCGNVYFTVPWLNLDQERPETKTLKEMFPEKFAQWEKEVAEPAK